MGGIPDPRTQRFAPAPQGTLRVVAWRQRTPTYPHPDLERLHAERAALLLDWARANSVEVRNLDELGTGRPAEFVEMIVDVAQATLTAGLGALVSGYVRAFFEGRNKRANDAAGRADRSGSRASAESNDAQSALTPLFAVTIVNESGGTVVVMGSPTARETERLLKDVTRRDWSDHTTVDPGSP